MRKSIDKNLIAQNHWLEETTKRNFDDRLDTITNLVFSHIFLLKTYTITPKNIQRKIWNDIVFISVHWWNVTENFCIWTYLGWNANININYQHISHQTKFYKCCLTVNVCFFFETWIWKKMWLCTFCVNCK